MTEPQPSEETGPGTHFRPDSTTSSTISHGVPAPASSRRLSKKNPYRTSNGSDKIVSRSVSVKSDGAYPSPPPSASPTGRSHRQEMGEASTTGRRRGSSLTERYPGDMSHRPLQQLAKEKQVADRSRQYTKKHHIRPDKIDSLDEVNGGAYHHGGPYDATLFARNNSHTSPLAALSDSNAEALKATPHEKIVDSVRGHRPLDGVAAYAPGESDRFGHVYNYEQGDNMMIAGNPEGGAYKRWPGLQYHPDDVKGKGEPSYTIEKALADGEKGHHRGGSTEGIEMSTRSSTGKSEVQRSGSLRERLSGGSIKRRIGSIKRTLHSGD